MTQILSQKTCYFKSFSQNSLSIICWRALLAQQSQLCCSLTRSRCPWCPVTLDGGCRSFRSSHTMPAFFPDRTQLKRHLAAVDDGYQLTSGGFHSSCLFLNHFLLFFSNLLFQSCVDAFTKTPVCFRVVKSAHHEGMTWSGTRGSNEEPAMVTSASHYCLPFCPPGLNTH